MEPSETEKSPLQEEMPFAVVHGDPITELPKDLYIPPEALEIFLEAFEGPLDLLLYLIKRQNLDILDIPIAEITRQYMSYIELMKDMKLELAAEYLVMAAMLAEIKSRMLLPRQEVEDEEDDPRAELIRRLQEYEQFKHGAQILNNLPQLWREHYPVSADISAIPAPLREPTVEVEDLLIALKDVLERSTLYAHHQIRLEPLSVRERMTKILATVDGANYTEFVSLFTVEEGRRGVVVTLLAILDLIKEHLIEVVQRGSFSPIQVRALSS